MHKSRPKIIGSKSDVMLVINNWMQRLMRETLHMVGGSFNTSISNGLLGRMNLTTAEHSDVKEQQMGRASKLE